MAEGLAEVDLNLLAGAPAAVFAFIAGADGTVDRAEQRRFEAMLSADHSGDSQAIAAIVATAAERGTAALDAAGGDAEALLGRAVERADEVLGLEDCAAYKQGLYLMGEAIARSSGGGLLGLGNRVDGQEQAALDRLRQLLHI